MIIHRLYLKNFGCIEEQTFEFDQDRSIFMLHGRNGKGKSTVLQAISLLLINDTKDNLKDLIRWGESEFELEIEFSYDGHTYLEKICCDGAADRTLIVDGEETTPFKNSDAIKYLASILDPRMFKASALAMQNELDIVKTSPADRRDYLIKVYDLDFKRSIESLEGAQNAVETKLSTAKASKLALENLTYDFLQIIRPPFGPNGLVKRQSEIDDIRKYLNLVESEIKARVSLESSITELTSKLITSRLNLEAAKLAVSEHEQKLKSIDDNQKQELSVLNLKLKTELDALEAEKVRLNDLVSKEPQFTIDESFKQEVETSRSRVSKTSYDIEELQKRIDLHQKGLCPTCSRPFEAKDLNHLDSELVTLQQSLTSFNLQSIEAQSRLTEYETLKTNYEQSVRDWNSNKQLLTLAVNSIAQQKLDEIEQRNKLIETQKTLNLQLKSMTDVLNTNQTNLEKEVQTTEISLQSKQKELSEAPKVDEADLAVKKDRLTVIEEEVSNYNAVLIANKLAEESNEKLTAKQLKDQNEIQILQEIIVKEELNLANHVSAIKIFKRDFPSFVVTSLIDGIVNSMNRFLVETYEGRYSVELEEVKTGIRLVYGPQKADVSRLSGYEQQVFSSAWRNAREELTGYGILLADEADAAADRENSLQLYRTICSSPIYKQIVAISHREETRNLLEQEFDAAIFEISS